MNFSCLLSISIPTYKRTDEFSRIIGQLSSQLRALAPTCQSRIQLIIHENPSQNTQEKFAIFKREDFGACPAIWLQNDTNIGADLNINQAYSACGNAEYVWVIGDDEQLHSNAISSVVKVLESNPSLGLLILINDNEYHLSKEILHQQRWTSYYHFANMAAAVQPHLLIAHSLISCNVVRSSAYNPELALNEVEKTAIRWNLPFCFSHMKGIVGGLSENSGLTVLIESNPILDTSKRSPMADSVDNEAAAMKKLYRLYTYWLIHEFGLDSDLVFESAAMNFLLPSSFRLFMALSRRPSGKLRHLLHRFKSKLNAFRNYAIL